jgi:hypothetical protein
MANTTNFNWETPDDTDLVKDGAAAIRTLGSSIDTSFVDLKGGTTGQLLSKNSNTDLDFTWAAAPASSALVLIATASPSGASSTAINSCFSSTYDDYLLVFDFTNINTETHYGIRLRSGSTDTTANYSWSGSGINSNAGIDDFGYESQNYLGLGYVTAGYRSSGWVSLHSPFLTQYTLAAGTAVRASSASRSYNNIYAGVLHDTTSYNGVTIYSPNNLTGTVRVYGVAK